VAEKRPPEHIKAQKSVKKRDNNECEICGVTPKTAHGHHVIPYSEGGPADLNNMMTLCPDCHRKIHNGQIKLDIILRF